MTHVVVAAAVQFVVGSRLHFLETGAVLPEGVSAADLDRLEAEGFIAEVEVEEPEDETPEEPNLSWNHARFDAWAADQDPVVVFTGENPTKAQKLEQIAALAQK